MKESILNKIFDSSSNLSNEEAIFVAKTINCESDNSEIPIDHECDDLIEAIGMEKKEVKNRLDVIKVAVMACDGTPSKLISNLESILLNDRKMLRSFLVLYNSQLRKMA
jgi:hypothetical protein